MKKWLIAALAGFALLGTAQAENWRLIYDHNDGQYFIDDASLDLANHKARFKLIPKDGPLSGYFYIILTEEADCAKNQYQILHYDVYQPSGTLTESADAPPNAWLPAIPNTSGEQGVKAICGQPKEK